MTAQVAGVVMPADGMPTSQGAQGAVMHQMHCPFVYWGHALNFGHVQLESVPFGLLWHQFDQGPFALSQSWITERHLQLEMSANPASSCVSFTTRTTGP